MQVQKKQFKYYNVFKLLNALKCLLSWFTIKIKYVN